ncbi:MAG: hypothetical protein WBA39_13790 [Rivularia sp. (in: cyanobacteria)]
MRILSTIKTKLFPFAISILGLSLLISLTASCSSTTPSDEIPPVAKDIKFINPTSRQIWRDNRERYLKRVEKNLYEEEGISDLVIESIQEKNVPITIDKEIFLIQSCEHGNGKACSFIQSQSNKS